VVIRQKKYYKRSLISEAKFRQLVRLFAQDLPASVVAALTRLERKTVNNIFFKIRVRIAQECELESPLTAGDVPVMSKWTNLTLEHPGFAASGGVSPLNL
jgi:hypothetical protein